MFFTYSDAFEGSHFETKGLSASGQVTTVALHEHVVELDSRRVEFAGRYSIASDWQVRFRLPYDVKRQRAKVRFVEPITTAERDAAHRNMEIHHRNTSYEGWSDATVLVAHRSTGILGSTDTATLAIGSSIPIGRIERDPFVAGEQGRRHRHIQFGSGTFDPSVEAGYYFPISGELTGQLFGTGRFPLYENRYDYRGAVEVTGILGAAWRPVENVSVHGGYGIFRQGFAHWSGHRDENSGLVSHLVLLGVGAKPLSGLDCGIDLSVPVYQDVLGPGDSFDQALSVAVSISVEL